MGNANIRLKNKLLISVKVSSGIRGPIGITPALFVQDTITGDFGQPASVTISGTAEVPGLTFTIPQGRPFDIAAKYESIDDLVTNTNPNPVGYEPILFDLAIIQSNVEDADNARLYIFDDNNRANKGGWTFVSDLSGATGPRRNLRWRPNGPNGTTSILEWENEDGSYNQTDARDLALKFNFTIDSNNELILTIENPDGITDTINLTATGEFGDGQNATVTSIRFNDNNGNSTAFQELGVYASWNNTELVLTNPDTQTVEQELALDFNWDGTTLQIKNPTEETYSSGNEQKLSPDIEFRTDTNGVEISVVEPVDEPNFIKISPDIEFDGTKIAVTEPTVSPTTEDFVELGIYGEFGGSSVTDTTLVITNPDEQQISQELGVYGDFGGSNLTDTTLVLTNPDNTTVEQELGVYASWNNTELVLTNPDNTTVEQELALDFNWDGTTLQIKNPTDESYISGNEQKLSPDIAFRNDGSGLELSIVEPGTTEAYNKVSPDIDFDGTKIAVTEPNTEPNSSDYVELGIYGAFGGLTVTDTTLVITNPDSQQISQELGVYADFSSSSSDTTIVFTNPNMNTVEQELGVYGEFGGTNLTDTTLTLTNPDDLQVSQELGVYGAFGGSGKTDTTLVLTNPDGQNVDQELGVYADFSSSASDTTIVFTNPDMTTVEQELGVYASYEDITKLVLSNPDGDLPAVELGLIAEFEADTGDSATTLKVLNPQGNSIKQELGVYGEFGEGSTTATTLTLTNPDTTPVVQELGVYASFDSSASDTTIVLTNPDDTTVEQELGVYASFTGTELVLTNPDNTTVSKELGLSFDWDNTLLGVKTDDDQTFTYQKLSPDIAFQNIGNGLEVSFVEPGTTEVYNKISPDINWLDTKLAITEPDTAPTSGDYVELGVYGEFGAEYVAGTEPNEITGEPDVDIIEFSDTILKLTNPDGDVVQQELGVYGRFGGEITVLVPEDPQDPNSPLIPLQQSLTDTTLVITNPDQVNVVQELGLIASFQNTALIITNPDDTTIAQELALQFEWNNTTLGVKNPVEASFTTRKLSPDIAFDTSDGVSISVVEPTTTTNFIKISPDINFQNIGNGLELSIVEPGGTINYNKISPDITFDGTQLAITEPGVSPTTIDFIELGIFGSFGGTNLTDTTLVITNPDLQEVSQELGVYAQFGGSSITDTTLVLTNPDQTTVEQELGVYATFNGTELTLTNPDTTEVTQELALDFNWDGTTLQIKNPAEQNYDVSNEQKLSPDITFDTDDGVFVSIVEPGTTENLIKISPDIYFQGTSIAIMEPGISPTTADFVDLKGATGDASTPGTPLFKIRDDVDDVGDGFEVTVADELKFTGGTDIFIERINGVFAFNITEVDGGDF